MTVGKASAVVSPRVDGGGIDRRIKLGALLHHFQEIGRLAQTCASDCTPALMVSV